MIIKDLPLVGFTLLSQLSVGAIVLYNFVIFLPAFRNKTKFPLHFKTIPAISLILLLIAIAISILHLGKPLRALNTLQNLGNSWLSREIFLLIVYSFFMILFNLFLYYMSEWKRLILVILNLTTLSGFALLFSMSSLYSASPVPLWHPSFTFLNFLAATLSMGGAVVLLASMKNGSLSGQRSLAWIISLVIFLEIIFIPVFLGYLDNNSEAGKQSVKLILEDYNLVFYFRLAFQIISFGFAFLTIFNIRSDKSENKKLVRPVIILAVLVILSEIFGRILFYAAMVPIANL